MQSAVGSDEEELAAGSGSIVNGAPGVVVAELPANGSEITSSKSTIVTFGLCRMARQVWSAHNFSQFALSNSWRSYRPWRLNDFFRDLGGGEGNKLIQPSIGNHHVVIE